MRLSTPWLIGILTVRSAWAIVRWLRPSPSVPKIRASPFDVIGGVGAVVQPAYQFVQRDRIVLQRHRRGRESQSVQLGEPLDGPVVRIVAADAGPRDLEHRAHGHARRAPVQRVAARRGHQHGVDAQRRGRTTGSPARRRRPAPRPNASARRHWCGPRCSPSRRCGARSCTPPRRRAAATGAWPPARRGADGIL